MSRFTVEVRSGHGAGDADTLYAPPSLGRFSTVRVGGLRVPIRHVPLPAGRPPSLALRAATHGLVLPEAWRLTADVTSPDELRVGPLLGVLTAGFRGRTTPGNPFAYQDYLIRHLGAAAQRWHGLVFAFEPEDIDWGALRITGRTFANGRWHVLRLPLPDAVYNRVPNRRLEGLTSVQLALRRFSIAGVPVFNPCFIDKALLYDRLSMDADAKQYVPETRPLGGDCDISDALARWQLVYLKPRNGSLGNGIIRVESRGGMTHLFYRVGVRSTARVIPTRDLSEALRLLTGRIDYVVQRGIDALRYRGRKFDVRCLCQKDGGGNWHLTGMGVRVAGASSVTTHVPAGGSIAPLREVLSHVFGDRAHAVERNLHTAVAALAPAVERGLADNYGELSMDLGLDAEGGVWFFEANSKPHKFDENAIRHLSWDRTVAYAAHLGGFPGLGG